jgi:mycoredoxin-dependent peroxiredoxin
MGASYMDAQRGICEALKASRGPLLLATAALLLGVPSYLLLERWATSAPAFLDRPWPLWAAEALLGVLCAVLAVRAGKGARRRVALAGVATALASSAGLAALVKRDLPRASSEIAVGQLLPEMHLRDELGRPVSLAALRGQPTVLVFYRGALCVACRKQLSALAARAAPFIAAGVRIFGVSADPPAVSAECKSTLGLPFSLLSDPQQGLAGSLCSSAAHCVLLIDPEGKIRWGALNDYWRGADRPEPVLLAAYRLTGH